jgi:hypothetical protein
MVGTAILASLVADSMPAEAAPARFPTTAMDRCMQNTTADWATTVHLEGGRGTKVPDLANQVRPGDVVRIIPHPNDEVSTTGWWWQPAEAWNWVNPAGVAPRISAPLGYPAPGLNEMSLIGQFTGFRPFEVMQNQDCKQMRVFGVFDLRINDPQDWDNFGSWDVDVAIYRSPVVNGSFDNPAGIASPWFTEGNSPKVVSDSAAHAAIISNGGLGWNAVLQTIPVRPFTNYELDGDFKTSANTAFFGVRLPGMWPPTEQHFGPTPPDTWQRLRQPFNSGPNTSVTIFAGFWGTGEPHFMVIDNIVVLST